MKAIPYTTPAGLRIGCMWQTNVKPDHDSDALTLQSALLARHSHRSQNVFFRLINAFWRWA